MTWAGAGHSDHRRRRRGRHEQALCGLYAEGRYDHIEKRDDKHHDDGDVVDDVCRHLGGGLVVDVKRAQHHEEDSDQDLKQTADGVGSGRGQVHPSHVWTAARETETVAEIME